MTDTSPTGAPAGFLAGPAAYLVRVAELDRDRGPFLMLQCTHWREQPQRCGNVLPGHPGQLDVAALLDAALEHDLSHPSPDRRAIYAHACEQDDLYGRYVVSAENDEPLFVAMCCPYGRPSAIYCPGPKEDRECLAFLVPERPLSVPLGTLLQYAAEHEVGRNRAIAEQFVPELAAQHIAAAGVAAGREVADARRRQHDAEDRYNRVVSRIGGVRRAWATVQQQETYTGESADGSTAAAAAALADLIGRMIADIDKAMTDAS